MTGIAAGFGIWALWNPIDGGNGGRGQSVACAIQDSAFLEPGEYGDFVEITNQLMDRSPYHGLGPDAPLVGGYVQGRIRGAITALAYQSPYKEENDQLKRSLGYEGSTPLVPLSGAIVRDNAGLLEVYQVNDVFKSEDVARSAIETAGKSGEGRVTPDPDVLPPQGDEMAVSEVPGDSPDHETLIGVAVRWGRILSSVSFQGGAGLNLEQVAKYVEEGLSRITTSCAGSTESGGQQ